MILRVVFGAEILLVQARESVCLTLQDVITGIDIIYKLPSAELFDTDS